MNVLDDIAALVNAGQRGAEMNIHVSQKTMLGVARPHDSRTRISFLNLDINIGKRRIKRAGVGVRNGTAAGPQSARTPAGEKDQDLFMRRLPKTRGAGGQDNYGTFFTVTN